MEEQRKAIAGEVWGVLYEVVGEEVDGEFSRDWETAEKQLQDGDDKDVTALVYGIADWHLAKVNQ